MSSGPGLAAHWTFLLSALADSARENLLSSDFIFSILQNIRSITECLSVTYVYCSQDEAPNRWTIKQESYPQESKFKPVDSEKSRIFDSNLILSPTARERFFQPRAVRDGKTYWGYILQTRLAETEDLYALCLVFDDIHQPLAVSSPEKRTALSFLNLFAHTINSKKLSEAEGLRTPRLDAVNTLLSLTGTIQEVAKQICQVWRNWLGVPAIRFWNYNKKFQELDLLYVCSEANQRKNFELSNNSLPRKSLGTLAINNRQIIRIEKPTLNADWDEDKGLATVLEQFPQLICVPVISADYMPNDPQTPRFIGLLDLHVRDVRTVKQPDERLLFLGTISASAILRARSLERYNIIRRLNEIAIDLVNPRDQRKLEERKDTYLENVIQVILTAVNANCVSIFEADESREIIRCVATTGIENHPEFKKTVRYEKDRALTWRVFTSGESMLVNNLRKQPEYQGIFPEKRLLPRSTTHDPMLAVPLPGQTPQGATGVVRILERKCPVNSGRLQNFSESDLELIELIAYQVSPALQMIRMQAHRELFVERTTHQVLQPLQGVIAYASNILEGVYKNDPEKEKRKLRYVRQMANAAAGMMQSTQWAARLTDFNFLRTLQRRRFNLTEYFIDRIIDLQPIREHEEVKVEFINAEQAKKWGDFLVDERFFDQAVQNILHNAVKYAYPKTTIEIKLLREIKDLSVFITSTGVPIDQTEEERIFWDRGRGRLASNYDRHGTGQGLYIARQIMRGFGGDIVLLSHEEDHSVMPPNHFPTAQQCTFKLFYPGAFQ